MESKLKNRRSFTPEFKLRIAVLIVSGQQTIAELSRQHQIKDTVISRWRDQFLERGTQIFDAPGTDKEKVAEMERELGRQHMEIEILKKASKRLL